MTGQQAKSVSRRSRWILVAACALAAAGLGVRWRFAPGRVSPAEASEAGLVRMLQGEEDDAATAQEEMERRFGTAKVESWRAALDSPASLARSLAVESVGKTRSAEIRQGPCRRARGPGVAGEGERRAGTRGSGPEAGRSGPCWRRFRMMTRG